MGLLYNRDAVHQGRSRPGQARRRPGPRSATAAKKIAALGDGTVGYGDYSKSNTGGWHFTAEMYSRRRRRRGKDGDTWKAAFNNDKGKQVLQQLKDMRWTDNSMGEKQLLEWADLLQHDGRPASSACTSATADNIPTIVNQYKGKFEDYGLGPIPGGKGTLGGGDGYMFKAGLSPEKIKAGLKWLTFKVHLDPDRIAEDEQVGRRRTTSRSACPSRTSGPAPRRRSRPRPTSSTPTSRRRTSRRSSASMRQIPLKLEPPNAQQIYAVLDMAMQKVLTDQNANIDQLLADAETQVNSILASVK